MVITFTSTVTCVLRCDLRAIKVFLGGKRHGKPFSDLGLLVPGELLGDSLIVSPAVQDVRCQSSIEFLYLLHLAADLLLKSIVFLEYLLPESSLLHSGSLPLKKWEWIRLLVLLIE